MTTQDTGLVSLTADIVSAHVTHNSVAVSDLPMLIANVYASLTKLGLSPKAEVADPPQQPAVSVRTSIKPDYLVCLECGNRQKILKRHLATNHQMTPVDYRTKWKLPADYPMVAPNYTDSRRKLALSYGLGTRRQGTSSIPDDVHPADAAPAADPAPEPIEPPKVKKPRQKVAAVNS